MQIEDKKCRICGEVPKNGFSESRTKRYDWICTPCANLNQKKWWAKLKLAKKAKRSNVNLMNLKGKIIQGIDAISIIDKPRCNICNDVMHHNRTIKTPKGTPLKWQCYKCNEIIKAEDL